MAIHHRNVPGFRIVSKGWQWPITANEARRRKSLKRGGDYRRQPFDDVLDRYENQDLDIMALDDALFEPERFYQRQAQVVQLRWFAELTIHEVVEVLNVSVSTVEQDWRTSHAFLRRQVSEEP